MMVDPLFIPPDPIDIAIFKYAQMCMFRNCFHFQQSHLQFHTLTGNQLDGHQPEDTLIVGWSVCLSFQNKVSCVSLVSHRREIHIFNHDSQKPLVIMALPLNSTKPSSIWPHIAYRDCPVLRVERKKEQSYVWTSVSFVARLIHHFVCAGRGKFGLQSSREIHAEFRFEQ